MIAQKIEELNKGIRTIALRYFEESQIYESYCQDGKFDGITSQKAKMEITAKEIKKLQKEVKKLKKTQKEEKREI